MSCRPMEITPFLGVRLLLSVCLFLPRNLYPHIHIWDSIHAYVCASVYVHNKHTNIYYTCVLHTHTLATQRNALSDHLSLRLHPAFLGMLSLYLHRKYSLSLGSVPSSPNARLEYWPKFDSITYRRQEPFPCFFNSHLVSLSQILSLHFHRQTPKTSSSNKMLVV